MTELLNGRRFEGRAAGKGAAPPRTAPQRSDDIASRLEVALIDKSCQIFTCQSGVA